jgi:transposase-like protein
MDAEVTDLVGAEPHQRTTGRTTYRNGYRDREWDTRVGTLELQIPKANDNWGPVLNGLKETVEKPT